MHEGWIELKTIKKDFFELKAIVSKDHRCGNVVNFVQLAFDFEDECMVTIDSKGFVYWIDLSTKIPCFKRLGQVVEQATFVAFNPIDKCEILIGLASADIKIKQLNKNFKKEYCTLIGHKIPPVDVSFHKNYCLTGSSRDVIIWNLKSYNKIHQLKIDTNKVRIKKSIFSPLGHLVVLYHNDTVQIWIINDLKNDIKLDLTTFEIRNIRDFNFTRNGRAILITGAQNKILALDTNNWKLMKKYNLEENIRIKQINAIPLPLDGGANKIVAILLSNCVLNFFDLTTACFVNEMKCFNGIRKVAVSSNGKYLAWIENEGNLKLLSPEKLFRENNEVDKIKESHRPEAHKIDDHLRCIRWKIKKELSLKRVLPILKEFGEYPQQYRVLIWSTILKLPTNKNAYISLADRQASNNSTLDIFKNCHLLDRNKTSLLTTTIECLIHWCPLLVQSSFIPNLVFPFLVVSQKNPLLAFELVLSILLNYCQNWFEYHPLPPLNILGILENILLEVDPILLNVFCKHGITSTDYAWPLLQSAMSEVLSEKEWLILWDHLITHRRPSFLPLCVIAYTIYARETIISFLHTPEDFKQFYTTQGNIRTKDLIKIVEQIDRDVPSHLHPSRYIKDEITLLPGKGPYPPFMLKEYPQFLIEDFHVLQYKRSKEENQILQSKYCETGKISEDERLNRESLNFLKQIQDKRMKEAQQCFQQQNHDLPRVKSLMREEELSKCVCGKTKSNDEFEEIRENRLLDLEKLQEDVDLLEDEVQTFLGEIS